jgi:hypothetical protein
MEEIAEIDEIAEIEETTDFKNGATEPTKRNGKKPFLFRFTPLAPLLRF